MEFRKLCVHVRLLSSSRFDETVGFFSFSQQPEQRFAS
jgi:hypothetical protein